MPAPRTPIPLPPELTTALEIYADRTDVDKIRDAYQVALEAHGGQTRASGEEFVTHTVEVATILAQLRLDTNTIVAGLIHDTVEDTELSLSDIKNLFGSEVVQSSTVSRSQALNLPATEQQVENYRKMLLSMASDARVILVKLADRLHNMILEYLSENKQTDSTRNKRYTHP